MRRSTSEVIVCNGQSVADSDPGIFQRWTQITGRDHPGRDRPYRDRELSSEAEFSEAA